VLRSRHASAWSDVHRSFVDIRACETRDGEGPWGQVGRRGRVTLQSAADGYEPIVISDDDRFSLIGEVVASVREYRRS
jgi:hypothetical protein